ncbi:hypothetical protein U1E44_06125 [Arenibacter sp. GZD96]|uniref:hypothetical protein n=1 Tax=Aurantibrevibacter litoralis TaxID=3106030 RepID=UPI002AFDE64D|nr:hypothetical protein [Arenibacter sp. GZD-96]MEA1785658.1 hypothetical protein [Arenibacter sp. GZD-96]
MTLPKQNRLVLDLICCICVGYKNNAHLYHNLLNDAISGKAIYVVTKALGNRINFGSTYWFIAT